MHDPVVQVQFTDMETKGSFLYADGKVYLSGEWILLSERPIFLVSNSEFHNTSLFFLPSLPPSFNFLKFMANNLLFDIQDKTKVKNS